VEEISSISKRGTSLKNKTAKGKSPSAVWRSA